MIFSGSYILFVALVLIVKNILIIQVSKGRNLSKIIKLLITDLLLFIYYFFSALPSQTELQDFSTDIGNYFKCLRKCINCLMFISYKIIQCQEKRENQYEMICLGVNSTQYGNMDWIFPYMLIWKPIFGSILPSWCMKWLHKIFFKPAGASHYISDLFILCHHNMTGGDNKGGWKW